MHQEDTPPPQSKAPADIEQDTMLTNKKDQILVAEELQWYLKEGILDEVEYGDFNLVKYWQVCAFSNNVFSVANTS